MDQINPVSNSVCYSLQISFPLFTGHGVVAANSSIPSKYQTLVTSNADRRGFGATSKRFNYDATVVRNTVFY